MADRGACEEVGIHQSFILEVTTVSFQPVHRIVVVHESQAGINGSISVFRHSGLSLTLRVVVKRNHEEDEDYSM